MKQNKKTVRDPYYYWKILNMLLAVVVLLLVLLVLVGEKKGLIVPVTYCLGALMSALSGVMELTKGKRLVGYVSAVIAGVFVVALLLHVIRIW